MSVIRFNRLLVALAASLLVMLVFNAGNAYACTCVRSSPEEQLQRSDAVFSGKVVDVRESTSEAKSPRSDPPIGGPITFDVEKSWKGDLEEQVIVNGYGEGGSGCGVAAREGERYLVYARYGGEGEDGPLETSVCDGTKPLAYAENDLRTLDPKESTLPESGGSVPTSGMWSGMAVVASATFLSLAVVVVLSFRRRF